MHYLDLLSADLQLALWKIAVGATVAIPCAVLGCYLVLRRISLIGDAISHGVLPGIALAVLLSGHITGWPVIVGAMLFGLLTAILTRVVHSVTDIPEDSSMGVVFTGLFALGVVLVSLRLSQAHLDTNCILFGRFEFIPNKTFAVGAFNVPTVFPTMLIMLVGTILFVTLFWKELKVVAFDSELATAMGLSGATVHYLLMAMVAGATVTAFEAVGSVLVLAMLIVPAAAAHLLTDRLLPMLLWAAGFAVLAVVGGVVLAASLDTNSAGMIAVSAGGLFALTVFFAPRHGVAVKVIRNIRLGIRIVAEDILAELYRQEEAKSRGDGAAAAGLLRAAAAAADSFSGRLALFFLRRKRQIAYTEEGVLGLTPSGRERAESLVRSHRLWEAYLQENFELPPDHLHDPATRMEHFIGPQLREKLAEELERPDTDPHGRAIP